MIKTSRGWCVFSAMIGLFFIFCCISSTWAQVKSETEPNDSMEQANEIRIGQSIEGYFQKDRDYDWYKLVVDKPGKNYIRIDLSGVPGINSELRLCDEKGNTLWDIDDADTGGPESIVHFPVNPGIYYLRIYGGGKAAKEKYILSSRITDPWQEGQESEPNDRRESANELKLGQVVGGYFEKRRDEDWFKLIVDKPGKSLVQIDVTAVPGVDSSLVLRDENGRSIWETNETRENGPESIFNLALAQGTYYIQLSAREANINSHYVLHTRILGPWQEGLEAEPNDARENATEIRLGQSVEGYFQRDNDYDWFKLVVDKPGKNNIQVDLSGVPGVEAMFEILDKDGKELWRADDASKGELQSVKYFTVVEGVYYIMVRGYQKNITNKYILSTRLLGPWQENEEAEPNDRIGWASEIKLNAPITGRINLHDDTDYYVLNVPEPGMDIIDIQLSGVSDIRWNFDLLDPKENRLDESSWHEAGNGEEIVKMKFKPGAHYLRVRIRGGKNPGAEYTIYAGKPQKPPATPEEVRQALLKALDFLASKQQKDGSWSGYQEAYTGLSLQAFIGGKCAQKDYSINIKGAINYLKSKYEPSSKYPEGSKDAAYYGGQLGTREMYQHAIATLALIEALVDLNDASLEPIAQDALNLIIRSQNTDHKPETLRGPIKSDSPAYGGWRYNPDSTDSDISVTGWQILALKAAVNAGFSVPEWAFPAAAKFVRSLQGKKDGSFNYSSPGDYGETCGRAGMGALSLQLCGFPQDPAIPPALRFMQDYAPRWNIETRGGGYAFYYWYYGTRAMYLAGGDDWRIWKDWMCRFLVDHQNGDGSWDGTSSERDLDIYRVALGAMMLEFCCGNVPIYMSPVKRLGPASLRVNFEQGAEKEIAKNVEIIMDASNSMTGLIGKETKITVARRVLTQIINGLPDTMNVGFRVYGHRYPTDAYQQACQDTELLMPIGPVQKAKLVELVNKIQTKGRTPLVLSVLQAIKDFEKLPNGSVVLVTDGIESCNGDIKSIAPAIKKSGLDLKVHIVGFDIKEKESREQLEAIAKSTEGMYLDAKDAKGLLSALEQALKIEYVVLDDKGEIKAKGFVGGDAVKIPEGTYTLRVMLAPQPLETKVKLASGDRPIFTLKKEAGKWSLK
jgi:hypothetical protein